MAVSEARASHGPEAAFARAVQDAMAHLYDPITLQRHPLATRLRPGASGRTAHLGKALRQALLDAMAALRPPTKAGEHSAAWRRYRLLELRYVEALDPTGVQQQLGIAKTHYYREHRQALTALASLLAPAFAPLPAAAPPDGAPNGATIADAAITHGEMAAPATAPTVIRDAPTRLPAYLTSFIGRQQELADLVRLLTCQEGARPARLITLLGAGGAGKTRLAVEVAAALPAHACERVVFIRLAPVTTPHLVLPTVAATLGIPDAAGSTTLQRLQDVIGERSLVLVLDNFEQVLDAAAQVATLVAACPQLRVLVTSRAALRVSGEQEYPVAPLPVPSLPTDQRTHRPEALEKLAENDAVRLFVERAQAVAPDFALCAEDASAVARICARLDGLPLAIELAAARVRFLPPAAMLAHLESAGYLPFLAGGARDLPTRHQTLRATIAWSYDLLGAGEQRLFRTLSVFRGGGTLEAASAVYAAVYEDAATLDVLDVLESLIAKSLVLGRHSAAEEPRFVLLETIREFALERLEAGGDAARVRHQHAAAYLALAEQAQPELTGSHQAEWLARLHAEHANVRAALAWMLAQGEAEQALRLSGAFWRFWEVRGLWSEGRRWLEQALAEAGGAPAGLRARALHGAGTLSCRQSDHSAARAFLEQSLALRREIGFKEGIASTLLNLGIVASQQGDYATARERYVESLAVARELGDRRGVANTLNNLGNVAYQQGDYAAARVCYAESLALKRDLQDTLGIANTLGNLGNAATQQGEYAIARSYLAESLTLYRKLVDKRGIASTVNNLGDVATRLGEYATARECYAESLALRRELGDKRGMAVTLTELGNLAQQEHDATNARRAYAESLTLARAVGAKSVIADTLASISGLLRLSDLAAAAQAARLLGAASALRAAMGVPVPPSARDDYERTVASVQGALGKSAFHAAWAAGQQITLEEAIAEALATPLPPPPPEPPAAGDQPAEA